MALTGALSVTIYQKQSLLASTFWLFHPVYPTVSHQSLWITTIVSMQQCISHNKNYTTHPTRQLLQSAHTHVPRCPCWEYQNFFFLFSCRNWTGKYVADLGRVFPSPLLKSPLYWCVYQSQGRVAKQQQRARVHAATFVINPHMHPMKPPPPGENDQCYSA